MKKQRFLHFFLSIFFIGIITFPAKSQSVAVTKTNPVKLYMHYMPWFSAPQNPGSGVTTYGNGATGTTNKWGQHWTGGTAKFPDNLITVNNYQGVPTQVRDIWAHYHPLIGPYDGKDTAVIEYHLLLMKLSGIDGVMIDWYGKAGNGVGDAGSLLINSNALIGKMASVGLKYSLIVEDAGWKSLAAATDNGTYAINNYFNTPEFVKLGDLRGTSATNANAPLLGVFGPQKFKTPGQWNTILSGNTQAFLPLYNQSAQIGVDAGGEFAWPYPQAVLTGGANAWYANLNNYYQNNAAAKNIVLGTAFPGFYDFYGANGAPTLGVIPRTYGGVTTLSATLALYTQHQAKMDGIQLATWNDFSEGTIIEPTVEEGFQSLDTIQKFTGVPYTEADLQQVYRLFTLRKKYADNHSKQVQLNQVFNYFTSLQIPLAVELMDVIDNGNAPRVTVSSSGIPSEDGATATITITASHVQSNISVHYTIGGTRASSSYTTSPAFIDSVNFTPSDTTITFTINAIDDALINTNQTISLQLISDTVFNITGANKVTLTVIDNEIPNCEGPIIVNVSSAPKIDGAVDAIWAKAPANLISKTISGTIQTGSTWQAMYDATNLYVLVQVKDTNLSNKGVNDWDQDGVEIYIAGNNNKAGAYTANDHQYRFDWNILPSDIINGNTGNKTGVQYAIPTTVDGYTLEVVIPWTTIGGTAPVNWKQIGFDININDQHDDVGQREATVGWNGTNGDNYQNTGNFGTIALTVCNATITPAAPAISSISVIKGKEDYPFVYNILASNTPTSYTAIGLPTGLTFDAVNGVISGTPNVWGVFNATITAANSIGTDTKSLVITIDSTKSVNFVSINVIRDIALGTVDIQWIVDSEIVVKQYEVQRSEDSIHFTTVNTITAIGNDNIKGVAYSSTDADPLPGDNYYRIKATSLNAADAVYFSEIVKIDKLILASVYPNPVKGNVIHIPFKNTAASKYKVRLVNRMGQVIFTGSINTPTGNSVYPLQINQNPAAGVYGLELINEAGKRKIYTILF